MRHFKVISLIILGVILAACQPAVISEGVTEVVKDAHFFETTPTPASIKDGDSDLVMAKAATATATIAYPTPLSTYKVPSSLVTVSSTQSVNPTATKTSVPSNTPTAASTQAPTSVPTTAVPTVTTVKTNTPTNAPTATSVVTAAPTSQAYMFAVQAGSPVMIQNFVNSSAGCSWQGIAGQVFDTDGSPIKNIVVKAGGTWNGAAVSLVGMTGAATSYGEGGYELVLGTKVVASNQTVWVQLYDLSGNVLSNKVNISTTTDCTKNLVLLNFKAISDGYSNYVPLVE